MTAILKASNSFILSIKVAKASYLLNVVMHGRWYVNPEVGVIPLQELIEEHVPVDSKVDMEILKRTVTNENEVSLTIYFCYEIDRYHAVLPFNVDS